MARSHTPPAELRPAPSFSASTAQCPTVQRFGCSPWPSLAALGWRHIPSALTLAGQWARTHFQGHGDATRVTASMPLHQQHHNSREVHPNLHGRKTKLVRRQPEDQPLHLPTDCPNHASSPRRCPSNSPAPWSPAQPKPWPFPCTPALSTNPPSSTGKPLQAVHSIRLGATASPTRSTCTCLNLSGSTHCC